MKYDVVIGGAGIPGLYAARKLARSNKSVVVLEKSSEAGEPNYSTAGITANVLKEFNLSAAGVNAPITKLMLGTKSVETIKSSKEVLAYILDFKKTKKILMDEIKDLGGKVLLGATIEDVIYEENRVVGIKTDEGDFYGKYIIDATGSSGIITTKVGMRKAAPCQPTVGMEYIVKVKKSFYEKYKEVLGIYMDTDLAPYGYAWLFHDGEMNFKLGMIEYWVDQKRNLEDLNVRLDKYLDWIGRDNIEKILEKHGGSKYLSNKFPTIYRDNVLGIADVVGGINPLVCEGIRPGLYSAKYAVEAILSDNLKLYSRHWNKYKGSIWKKTEWISKYILFGRQSQAYYEDLVNYADKNLSANDIADVGFYYNLKCVRKNLINFLLPTIKRIFTL
jgi:flavin-dependent dehydrogenase